MNFYIDLLRVFVNLVVHILYAISRRGHGCLCCLLHSVDKRQKPGQPAQLSTDEVQRENKKKSRLRARFSAPIQTGCGAHSASSTIGTGSLSRRQSGRDVALTTHPDLRVPISQSKCFGAGNRQ